MIVDPSADKFARPRPHVTIGVVPQQPNCPIENGDRVRVTVVGLAAITRERVKSLDTNTRVRVVQHLDQGRERVCVHEMVERLGAQSADIVDR